jgi:transposase-like protein
MTRKGKRGRQVPPSEGGGRGRAYPLSLRLRVVKEALRGDIPLDRLSRVFGPHPNTIVNWLALYDQGGEDALVPPEPVLPRRAAQPLPWPARGRAGEIRRGGESAYRPLEEFHPVRSVRTGNADNVGSNLLRGFVPLKTGRQMA